PSWPPTLAAINFPKTGEKHFGSRQVLASTASGKWMAGTSPAMTGNYLCACAAGLRVSPCALPVLFLDGMRNCELGQLVFRRQLHHAARIALLLQIWAKFVAPFDDDAVGRIAFQNLAAV